MRVHQNSLGFQICSEEKVLDHSLNKPYVMGSLWKIKTYTYNITRRAAAVAQVVERRIPQAIFKACVSSKLTYGSAAFV